MIVVNHPRDAAGHRIRTEVPLGPTTVVATGLDGIVVADNATYELRHHAVTGELVRVVRVVSEPRRVT